MSYSAEHTVRRTVRVGALAVLLLSALVIEGIPVVHAHTAGEPAIYNEECPLATLVAHTAGAPLPAVSASATALSAGQTPLLSPAPSPLPRFLSSAEPRAPPIH